MTSKTSDAPWGVDRVIASLTEITYFERAAAHILSGWIPKTPDMAVKVRLGLHLFRGMDRATRIRIRLGGLQRARADEPVIREGWRRVMERLDAAPDTATLIGGLYGAVWPRRLDLYHRHMESTDPLADGESVHLLGTLIDDVSAEHEWGSAALRELDGTPDQRFLDELEAAWRNREDGRDLPLRDGIWKPLDRVPRAARPAGLEHCDRGALGVVTVDAVAEPMDVAGFLHVDLDEEYATVELIARNSYEHPEMPWEFHLDMARHAADEARHALVVERLLNDRGFSYGDFPIRTSSYDGLYEFSPCEPGSTKELLWRMLIRQTFMEGLAIDSLAHDVRRRTAAGQHDISRAMDYLLRDEVFHAGSGLKWSSHLLGGDRRAVLQERYEAVTHFTTESEAIRADFVMNNLEQAMAELERIEEGRRRRGGKDLEHPLNRVGRVQAGYTDDEILQILSWGYVTE